MHLLHLGGEKINIERPCTVDVTFTHCLSVFILFMNLYKYFYLCVATPPHNTIQYHESKCEGYCVVQLLCLVHVHADILCADFIVDNEVRLT